MHFPTIVEIFHRLSGRKRWQILRRRCSGAVPGRKRYHFLRGRHPGGIWGRKRYHFLRGMGYQPPTEQENAPNPARKVCRECAEGTPRWLGAEKCIISCAEWDTTCLPSRKTPQFRRGRCSEAVPGRKRRQILRGMGYQPPAGQENAQNPARRVVRGCSGAAPRRLRAEKRGIF